MHNEYDLWSLAERSLEGSLSAAEQESLQQRLASDPQFAAAFGEQLDLLRSLSDSGRQQRFRALLKDVHQQLPAGAEALVRVRRIVHFHPRYWKMAAMAACVALLTSMTTVWSLRENKQTRTIATQGIQELNRRILSISASQHAQQAQIENIKGRLPQAEPAPIPAQDPGDYAGTGFAITNDGYVVTNYHVAADADSIYIQTRNGKYHRATVVAFEPRTDVAVLRIAEAGFAFGKGELPYSLAPLKAGLGASIFTLGFPQDEIVYSEGYIASKNGYLGDSMQYRLELPSEPGQSGAPVFDASGNVIGIITSNIAIGRDKQNTSTTYAVSSGTLLRLLRNMPGRAAVKLSHASRSLNNLSREQQLQKLEDYTCIVRVYRR